MGEEGGVDVEERVERSVERSSIKSHVGSDVGRVDGERRSRRRSAVEATIGAIVPRSRDVVDVVESAVGVDRSSFGCSLVHAEAGMREVHECVGGSNGSSILGRVLVKIG